MRAPTGDSDDLPLFAAELHARLRARAPRVHCLTNSVAQAFTANALLALGAVPSMTTSPDEIGDFVDSAQALVLNLGTFNAERRAAIGVALASAKSRRLPTVLDPVFVDRVPQRAALARTLVAAGMEALRLNAAELSTLAGAADDAALAAFARAQRTVVALTGATDRIADGERLVRVSNGHALMAQVTAMGCAASAMVAACLAVEADAWRATAAAVLMFGVAGEIAAARAQGPGSFAAGFIDTLAALDRDTLAARAKVTIEDP